MKQNGFRPRYDIGNIVFSNITAGDQPNWTETTIANLGDLLRLVYMWVRMSIFDKFSLNENGRIVSLKHELSVPKCSVALGKFNYAVLLKQFNFAIKAGIEQRDAAIKMGAKGATTLLYKSERFVMPSTEGTFDPLHAEPEIRNLLINRLQPIEDGDAIIIGSDDVSKRSAELAAKSAALFTIMDHEKHNNHFRL